MSALVIGTMTPDFSYLIRLAPGGGAWHTKLGLLEYCLPAGLAAWWIFRTIVGPALLRLLPPALGDAVRAQVAPAPTYRLVPAAVIAILLGALSHDVWDGFTHDTGWGLRMLPELHRNFHFGAFGATGMVRWYLILQYASSVIGLIAVGLVFWRWVAAQPRAARHVPAGDRAWRIRDMGLLLAAGVVGAGMNTLRPHPSTISWTLGYAAVGAMAALAVALVAYGIVDSIRHRIRRAVPPRDTRNAAQPDRQAFRFTGSNQSLPEIVDAEGIRG